MRFNLRNKEKIKSCQPVLKKLYTEHKRKYVDLFFYEKDIALTTVDLSPLVEVGILKKVKNKFRANVQVFPLSGKFICTDFIISFHKLRNNKIIRGRDDVWGMLSYESPYIAKKAMVKKGDRVLDLATGSGVIAIFCADKAKHVIATDINPKAINYAKFNAILNNVEKKIDFRVGDLFVPVKGLKFDLIIWNGPTVLTPDAQQKYPIYCFGGPDGLNFTRRFIIESPNYLNPNGKMQWLDWSAGDQDSPESMKIIKRLWKGKGLETIYEKRIEPANLLQTIEYLTRVLIKNPIKNRPKTPLWIKPVTSKEYNGWIKFLKDNNLTRVYAGVFKVCNNKKSLVRIKKLHEKYFKRMTQLPAEWHFLSYKRILHHLRICESY